MSDAASNPQQALAEIQAQVVRELCDVGMALARKLPEMAEREDADAEGLCLAYTRLSRAIRLTLMLETRLAAQVFVEPKPERPPKVWELKGLTQEVWSCADDRNSEAFQLVHEAIEREAEGREKDRLFEDLEERWDEDRDEAFFLSNTPVAQVVAAICREFRLSPNWDDFSADDFDDVEERTLRLLRLGRVEDIPPLYGEGGEWRQPRDGRGTKIQPPSPSG